MYQRILRLASHSVVYGLSSVASKVLALVCLPIVVLYIEVEQYGIAEMVLMVDLFAAALFRLGLQNAMMRFSFDAPKDARDDVVVRVVRTTLALKLISTLVGVLVLLAFEHQLASFFLGDPRRNEFIWLAAFGMWTSVIYSTITATFRIQQRPRAYLCISMGNVLLSTFLTLYFITELGWGVEGLLLGNFLGYFAMIPVAAVMQRRLVLPVIDRSLVRPMLRFAVPTIPIAIAYQALTMIDRTVIQRVEGLEALGVYGVAARFSGVVLLVVTALQLSWQPFAYAIKDDGEARRAYAVVTSWFAAVMGWLVAGLALLADPVVRGMTPPAYYEATRLTPLLALAAGIYGAYFLVGIGASRVKRTGWHALVAFAAVAVSFVANVLLVPWLGVMGAAVAALLANGTLVACMLYRAQRVFPVRYELGRIARPVLLLAIAMVVAYLLPTGTGWQSWTSRTAVALAWPLALVATGFVQPEERMRIVRLLRRGPRGPRGPRDPEPEVAA
ncbi:MAG: polysaccharide biosynthesis protein [Thermoleophilia bacterium]|nr:polysaccharide biosynthesis protein [Thermoleophilia bacterium]